MQGLRAFYTSVVTSLLLQNTLNLTSSLSLLNLTSVFYKILIIKCSTKGSTVIRDVVLSQPTKGTFLFKILLLVSIIVAAY